VLGLSIFGLTPGAAEAGTSLGTISSEPCPAPSATWRIGYRLYWSSSSGQSTTREALPEVLEQAKGFIDQVRHDSACGVRVTLDVFDEGDATWPASTESKATPADNEAFTQAGNYDWVFYRFPSNAESYCAITYPTGEPAEGTLPSVSKFPVNPQGQLGCVGPDSKDCLCEPWATLLQHEWLHAVVAFYNPRLGWPTPDVHGACEHGYTQLPCPGAMVNETYFADLMQGKVPENGTYKGIQPDEWSLQGTPANPLIQHADALITRLRDGTLLPVFPAALSGNVRLTIARPEGPVASEHVLSATRGEFVLPGAGLWKVCLVSPGSENYYRFEHCSLRYGTTLNWRSRRLRISRFRSSYSIFAVNLPAGSRPTLLVMHRGRTHQLRGRWNGGSTHFHLHVRGTEPWRVRLRLRLFDGHVTMSPTYVLRPRSKHTRAGGR
jgi:hypothetical protein